MKNEDMIKNIVFDFGGVLLDWNPRYVYEKLFSNKDEMEFFLTNICSPKWNEQLDAGKPFLETIQNLQKQYPKYRTMIQHYYDDWEKMISGEIVQNVKLLPKLKEKFNLLGLTNWSAETFPITFQKYSFFTHFSGIVVSGIEKKIKPNKDLFNLLLSRYQINANESIFIDDSLRNIKAAEELGFQVIHYTGQCLKAELERLNKKFELSP